MLLGYSLKPRLNIRALATAGYDRRFRSINEYSHSKSPFDENKIG